MDDYKNEKVLVDEELLAGTASYIERKQRVYQKYLQIHEAGNQKYSIGAAGSFSDPLLNYTDIFCDTLGSLQASCKGKLPDKEILKESVEKVAVVANFQQKKQVKEISDYEILEELLSSLEHSHKASADKQSFSRKLNEYMLEKNLYPVDIYKPLGMNRQLLSKMLNNPEYHPRKETIIGIGMVLKLNLEEFKDFLARADYAINPRSNFDSAIEYFVKKGFYDLRKIDAVLDILNLPTICKYN